MSVSHGSLVFGGILTIARRTVVIYLPQSQSTTRVSSVGTKAAPNFYLLPDVSQAYESHFTDARCTTLLTFSWNRCDKSVWLPFFTYTICTLVAQVAMTARLAVLFNVREFCG